MSNPSDKTLAARLTSEFVGTFTLVYVGMLAIANGAGLVGVAIAHGLAIAVMASAFMLISGAHFNPAVTFGAWLAKLISTRDAAFYVVIQLAAGLLGAVLVDASLGGDVDIASGVPALAPGVGVGAAILIEAILTFFLVVVVFGTGVDQRFGARIGGLAIGLIITADILAGGPLTGAAMNPARWFGPALVASDLADALVYTVGPLLGGAAGALLWVKVIRPGQTPA